MAAATPRAYKCHTQVNAVQDSETERHAEIHSIAAPFLSRRPDFPRVREQFNSRCKPDHRSSKHGNEKISAHRMSRCSFARQNRKIAIERGCHIQAAVITAQQGFDV